MEVKVPNEHIYDELPLAKKFAHKMTVTLAERTLPTP